MKKLTRTIAIGLLLAATSTVKADLIISTLDSTFDPISSARIDQNIFHAAEFVTDAQQYELSSATAVLRLGSSAGTVDAFLYDDVGGLPGNQVLAFTSFSPTGGGDQTVSFIASTPFVLAANTTYHLALNSPTSRSSPTSRKANWAYVEAGTLTTTGPGSAVSGREVSSNGGSSWLDLASPDLLFSIEGSPVAVPEPTSLGLLGAGVLVISHKRRQRRKQKQQKT